MAYLRIPWVLTRAHPEICYVPSDAEAAYRLNPVHPGITVILLKVSMILLKMLTMGHFPTISWWSSPPFKDKLRKNNFIQCIHVQVMFKYAQVNLFVIYVYIM